MGIIFLANVRSLRLFPLTRVASGQSQLVCDKPLACFSSAPHVSRLIGGWVAWIK